MGSKGSPALCGSGQRPVLSPLPAQRPQVGTVTEVAGVTQRFWFEDFHSHDQGKQAAAESGTEIPINGRFQANLNAAVTRLPQAPVAYVNTGEPGP